MSQSSFVENLQFQTPQRAFVDAVRAALSGGQITAALEIQAIIDAVASTFYGGNTPLEIKTTSAVLRAIAVALS